MLCIVCVTRLCACVISFFFFKQKTAYEMRISDWSSDVCSSDLLLRGGDVATVAIEDVERDRDARRQCGRIFIIETPHADDCRHIGDCPLLFGGQAALGGLPLCLRGKKGRTRHKSEEHTSELQSLMRISYAVFCLKKKKNYDAKKTIYLYRRNE